MWPIEPAAAASPETAMFAPPVAAGFEPTSSSTGSRMLPRTRPSRPPASATMKHQTPTAARVSACTRLNMAYDRTDATRERVGAAGARGVPTRAEGPADRSRHCHRSRHLAGPPLRDGVRQRARLGQEADCDAPRARGRTRGPAIEACARAADE